MLPMMLIGMGQRPQDLGGFRTHNPFRLWAQGTFRSMLRARPDARVVIHLTLGAGHWLAEAALAEGRPYVAVAPDVRQEADVAADVGTATGGRWTRTQLDTHARLLGSAALTVTRTSDAEATIVDIARRHHAEEGIVDSFVLLNEDRTAGRLVEAWRALTQLGQCRRAGIEEVLPPAYRVAGIIERVRAAIPEGLLAEVRAARAALGPEIDAAVAEPVRVCRGVNVIGQRPPWLQKAMERADDLRELEAALASLSERR